MSRFDPDTLALGGEVERLAARYDDLREQRETTDDRDEVRRLNRELDDIDQEGAEVSALIDEYGADATVTVRGLDAGEYAKVENKAAEAASRVTTDAGAPGSGRLIYAAAGLVEAPFYDGDPDDLSAKIGAMAGQPLGVRKWVEDVVNARTVADGKNWRDSAGRSTDEA